MTSSTSTLVLRDLNDYESMLATSTCNVGLVLKVSGAEADDAGIRALRLALKIAWKRTVAERPQLQVKLVPKIGDIGPLGQRYGLAVMDGRDHKELFDIVEGKHLSHNTTTSLVQQLQIIGTTALDISKGSFYVRCSLDTSTNITAATVHVIMSLCHAVSDGPGALRVARSFVQHLSDVLKKENTQNPADEEPKSAEPLHLLDLQALLLGNDYGKSSSPLPNDDLFPGQDEVTLALGGQQSSPSVTTKILPVEKMQLIPSDEGFGTAPGFIECVHLSLTAEETSRLRDSCRKHGTTVQGALVAAALKARLTLLGYIPKDKTPGNSSILAAVQIPVNTRSLSDGVDDDVCLCGSAGVWHTVQIPMPTITIMDSWWQVAQLSTQVVRAALKEDAGKQPREWLRRLFHAPATLPPYSIMVSSIGVAPVEAFYGDNNADDSIQSHLEVDKLLFFGGSLRTTEPSQAVASMIHATTFRGELHCFFNFTSPGISRDFAKRSAHEINETLIAFAKP